MEIKQYLNIIWRWAWLGILGLVLGMAGGYFFSSRQTPIFQANTKVLVSGSTSGLTTNSYPNYMDQLLAKTYVQLLSTQPIFDGVSE